MPADMRARLGQADLPNLVLSASGCAGAGRELAQFIDVARVGAVISKSIMAEPHTGNPAPRLAETPSGLLNSVGLQGPGLDAFLQRDLPWLLSRGARVVVSIAGQTIREFTAPSGIRIRKLRVPLGVVLVVYEARPNVTVDAAALCLKSANACILRGSRMAAHTNRVLVDVVREALVEAGLPADLVTALEGGHAELADLIADPATADVVIPRGGEELKKMLLRESRIPVLAAAGGNCHVYVDASADADQAVAASMHPGEVVIPKPR